MTTRWKYNKANTRDGVAHSLRLRSKNLPQKLKSDLVKIVKPQVEKVYEMAGENFHWKIDSLS